MFKFTGTLTNTSSGYMEVEIWFRESSFNIARDGDEDIETQSLKF